MTFDTRPRFGHNHRTPDPWWSKVTYMAHAKGYVMVRRPKCIPFVLTEKQWLMFPLFECQEEGRAALTEETGGGDYSAAK